MAKNTNKKIIGIVGKRFPNEGKKSPVKLTGNIVEHEIEQFDVDVDENGPFISSSLG